MTSSLPVSLRFNNPGAINDASWMRSMPGYQGAQETTRGNRTVRFDRMEHGVAAWWMLLHRYRHVKNVTTVGAIITAWGGGQDYSAYLAFVEKRSQLRRTTEVSLENDRVLLALADAMFAYEAGAAAYDANRIARDVIVRGFNIGRRQAGVVSETASKGGLFGILLAMIRGLFQRS
jgi:hypothetical protein